MELYCSVLVVLYHLFLLRHYNNTMNNNTMNNNNSANNSKCYNYLETVHTIQSMRCNYHYTPDLCTNDREFRLSNHQYTPSDGTVEGRLEVCFLGQWSSVCHGHNYRANLLCAMIGYTYSELVCHHPLIPVVNPLFCQVVNYLQYHLVLDRSLSCILGLIVSSLNLCPPLLLS